MKKIIYIFICLLFFISILFAQDNNTIEIRNFLGVINSGDLEDIPKEYLVELKNLQPFGGLLRKTYAFGDLGYPASDSLINIFTYLHNELDSGYVYYAIKIDSVTNQLYLRQYNYSEWIAISLSETFYQKYAVNPIVYGDGIVRILPGNKDSSGTNQCKGIWIGYIDRIFFDDIYAPSEGFFGYSTEIVRPDISIIDTLTVIERDTTAFESDEIIYYKTSYIYDGIQESLPSDIFRWDVNNDSGRTFIMQLSIKKTSHNKRITGINIYRSIDYEDGAYNLIHSIDLLRQKSDFFGDTLGAYPGEKNFYIPSLSSYDFDGDTIGNEYWIDFFDSTHVRRVTTPSNGDSLFTITGTANMSSGGWNVAWDLIGISNDDDTVKSLASGTDGAYGGKGSVIVNELLSGDNITGSLFLLKSASRNIYYNIWDYFQRAVRVYPDDSVKVSVLSNTQWGIFKVDDGNYVIQSSGDSVYIYFADDYLTEGAEHSLAGEVSININGEFAKIIAGRLWQANLILDPVGKSEIQTDWISYSELSQYDVNPVSNIITFANVGYGKITGILELFGNPVILKKQAIITIGVKDYPNTPANWNVIESVYNIGNISKLGSINVLGNIYVSYYDGVYRFSPNNLAESASTPSEKLKISEPISDVYEALSISQKENIIVQYDQSKNEIIYTLGDEVWAYSVSKNYWREIDSDIDIDFTYLSQDANAIIYDSDSNKVYSFGIKDTVSVELKTKTFAISEDERVPINIISVTYKSKTDLTLNLFSENSDTVRVSKTLPANNKVETIRFGNWDAVYKFSLGIIDSANSNTVSEIHKIRVEF